MRLCLLKLKHHNHKIILVPKFHTLIPKSYHQIPCKITPTHLNSLLNITTQNKNFKNATQIHAQIITNSYTTFPFLLNNLLNLYAKCGHINKSVVLFSNIEDCYKNAITWTSLIRQLFDYNLVENGLKMFNEMRGCGVCPNEFTFSAILHACGKIMSLINGVQMHGLICKHGFDSDVYVGSGMVDMYGKCRDMGSAWKLFDEMPERNLVTWNSLIVGCVENELFDRAVLCFKGVIRETAIGLSDVSVSSVLSACANMGDGLDFGKQVHGIVVKRGLMGLGYVNNSLMDMYCKCGSIEDAVELFRSVCEKDVVTWNVMMMGFVQINNFEEACKCLLMMRNDGVLLDEASFSIVLNACAGLAALSQGRSIHNLIMKSGFEKNVCISNSLITMYAKCGSMADAHRVFQEVIDPNTVRWTSIISAFQQHGCSNQVIELFENMLQQGIRPDYRTFVSVLSACAHAGRVDQGFSYFNSITDVHKINLGHEHYACMVDLLGRAGRLEEAKRFIEAMPIEPGPTVWGALLAACRNHGNLEVAKEAAERLFKIEPNNSGNYVILANMYTRKGKSKEADEIRRLMGVTGVRKDPGCSWIDVKNTTYVFTAHDRSHSRTEEIYEMLKNFRALVKRRGYVAETEVATKDVEQNNERTLWYHSEKLALAFGLLALPAGAPIRIMKNLRTCVDCHTVMKFASEIYNRDIIVRDVNRFHHFSAGRCSCGDYW